MAGDSPMTTDYLIDDSGRPIEVWCWRGTRWLAKSHYSRDEALAKFREDDEAESLRGVQCQA